MRRRDFITLIGSAAAAWPLAAPAQQARVYTIGVLTLTSPNPEPLLNALREGLRDAGYVEGRNLRLEIRSASGRPDLQLEKAAELVRLKVDLIVTFFTPTALAAKQATRDIPIVMAGAGDPVETGLVASLVRPGGNITGQSSGGAEVAGKSVELIRELIPAARGVGVLADESDPFAKPYVAQIGQAARSVGMEVEPIINPAGTTAGSRIRDPYQQTRGRTPHPGKHRARGNARLGDQISLAGIDVHSARASTRDVVRFGLFRAGSSERGLRRIRRARFSIT
jgi:putative tryptophan/tyrosine transport system substrate-binding protein